VGSTARHGSGEIVLAFSTANMVPRETRKMVYRMKILLDQRLDPLYEAVIEATEEAILNALCQARDMDGVNGNLSKALPLADVRELTRAWQRQVEGRRRASSQRRGGPVAAAAPPPATEPPRAAPPAAEAAPKEEVPSARRPE